MSVDWAGRENLHPLVLVATGLLVVAMLVSKRRNVFWPFALTLCFITSGQRLVLVGLDFPVMRILIFTGWLRIFLRGENHGFRWMATDYAVLLWAVVTSVAHACLQLAEAPAGIGAELIYRMGWLVDSCGAYFLLRMLVRDWEDVKQYVRAFIILAVPVALLFIVEKVTATNWFSVLGGVTESGLVREGRLRCQGSFAHPILAGTFWVCLMPLMASWWFGAKRNAKAFSFLGLLSSLVIIWACASSTPILAGMFGVLGIGMFWFRYNLRFIRWTTACMILALHLYYEIVRGKGVWTILSRFDLAGGSTGWYRYRLIQATLDHFHEWWLMGLMNTLHWGRGLEDLTNFYVLQAVDGGLLGVIFFVFALIFSFRAVGRVLRYVEPYRWEYWITWMLGVCLLQHSLAFFAVSYLQKPLTLFFVHLASIVSLEVYVRERSLAEQAAKHAVDQQSMLLATEPATATGQ